MPEMTIEELDTELAEQLPARELMCGSRCGCPHVEVELEVEISI
jgi:hypothetical protein